jgi:von Willebrand factor type A domain
VSGTSTGAGPTTGAGGDGGGSIGVGSSSGSGGGDCGRQNFDVLIKPIDILLVLDRSASMEDDPSGGSGSPSKWEIVVPALQQAITATDTSVSWGIKVFPEGDKKGACSAASFPTNILVPIASNNAVKVNSAITLTTDKGDGTPTGDAINKAVEYLSTLQDNHVKYLLLATDGDPSCPSGDAADTFALQAVTAAATAGYHTFVVGVASNASKIKALNQLAIAGLEPHIDPDPNAPQFYLASTQAELVATLKGITGTAATCLFPLSSSPPNPDHVGVFVGDKAIMKDTNNASGWDYTGPDMMTIELFGAACDQAKAEGAGMVKVIFGCKDDPIF